MLCIYVFKKLFELQYPAEISNYGQAMLHPTTTFLLFSRFM